MADVERTCEYVFDPDAPETWGGEEGDLFILEDEVLNGDGIWSCPHQADEGEDLCIFHQPIENIDDEKAVDAFLSALGNVADTTSSELHERKSQFLGASFGKFDISDKRLVGPQDSAIVMSYSHFEGEVIASGAEIQSDLLLSGANFRSRVDFSNVKFSDGSKASFGKASFYDEAKFYKTEFNDVLFIYDTVFKQTANFRGAKFADEAAFLESEFIDEALFSNAIFNGKSGFTGVEFSGKVDFTDVVFNGAANFYKTEFKPTNSNDIIFFNGTEFHRDVDFRSEFNSIKLLLFDNALLTQVDFTDTNLKFASFVGADLTDATLTDADLQVSNLEKARLSRAILFGCDLRGANLSGAIIGDVRINDGTQFLGRPTDDTTFSPHSTGGLLHRRYCANDPRFKRGALSNLQIAIRELYNVGIVQANKDKAKSVYRALEELGRKNARPRLAARSFVHRQDLQKDDYKEAARKGGSWKERLIAGARWSRAAVARATLLYGESPWRVISTGILVILLGAVFYPFGLIKFEGSDQVLTYPTPFTIPGFIDSFRESLYVSLLAFGAEISGFTPIGLGRLVVIGEMMAGIVLFALLIFVFGRRATR